LSRVVVDAGEFAPGSFFDVTARDATFNPGLILVCQVGIDGHMFMKHESKGPGSSVDCSGIVP